MTEKRSDSPMARRISRQTALRLMSMGGIGAIMTACGSPTPSTAGTNTPSSANPTATTASAATSAPAATSLSSSAKPTGTSASVATSGGAAPTAPVISSTPASYNFEIPDSGARLPTGNVQLRWMDSGDQKAVFFKKFFPVYHEKHPNIAVNYDGVSWNQIQQVETLGFRNGTVPDVFQLASNIPVAEAVANGWLGALDDVVPNWPEVKKQFPPGTFTPGATDFGNKTYGYPFTSNKRINNLLLFNRDYMEKAGYDAGAKVLSWDEFRAAAKKCTQQGAGKYYGLIIGVAQSGVLPGFVSTLAEMAGAHGGEFNYKTGKYNYTSDQYIAATELLLAIKSDGSIFPGSVSLDAPGARGRMPQGLSAMILQGPWNIPQWTHDNPNFHLGLNVPPQKDPSKIWPLSFGPGGSNTWFYYSKTKLAPVVGDVFSYLGSLNGQVMWATYDGAGDPPQLPAAFKAARLDPLSAQALKLGFEWTRLRPDPSVRDPDVAKVLEAEKQLTPNFNDTLVGLFTGQIQDVKKSLQDLQDRSDKELDRAIKVAQQRGSKITRDAWVFPNWDPTKDYTEIYK